MTGSRPKREKSFTLLGVATAFGLLLGCNGENLVPLQPDILAQEGYVTVDARFCTSAPTEAMQKIKYLFILDHSGSNQPGFPNPLTPDDVTATDPNGSRRYGPLVQFVDSLSADPNNLTYFSLIDFSDEASQPGGLAGFDSNASGFIDTYVDPDWIGSGTASAPVPFDHGFTNYQAALQMALSLITTDARNEAVTETQPPVMITYQIIFVSDGVPTVIAPAGSASPVYTQQFTTDIEPVISSILALKTDPTVGPFISGIYLNTSYYFQQTQLPGAEALLQQMATAGNGQYMQFGSGQGIMYQTFAPPVRNVKYILNDAWIENENAVWWDNGQLMLDSDGDGLPDQIEERLGSNPFSPDSDGNGVSDLVEYRTKGAPCADAHCSPAARDPYAICAGFSPSVAPDGTVTFASSANDGLNDCEKFVLGATRTTFDSNGDFIPDLMSLKTSIPFIANTTGALLDPFGDPLDNYEKLKAGYPISVSQASVLNFTARASTLTHESTVTTGSADTECYHLVANDVAVIGPGNKIKMSIIQNAALIDNKPILQTAVHAEAAPGATVVFNPGDFQ